MNNTITIHTTEQVIKAVRKYIEDKHPGGATLEVLPQGVRQDREWWYVPIRPSIQPPKRFEYYEALATVEQEVQKFENITVLLLPALPNDEPASAEG